MSKGSSLKIIAALKKKRFRPILVFTFGSFKENFLFLVSLRVVHFFKIVHNNIFCSLFRYLLLGGDFPIGDAYKLYWHFDRYEKNGIIGIFITVFLYIVTMFSAATILYMYFLRVHNSGRLLDVYHRLNGKEEQFFVPYDLEISLEELTYICRKAEQWRGEEGERRKVAVYDYVWEEEEVRNAPPGC